MKPVIRQATLPATDLGNDPNDNRKAHGYLDSIDPKPMDCWMDDYELDDSDIAQLESPEWVYKNLVLRGHICVIVAPPNGGKTTLFLHVAGLICNSYDVNYVNADVSGSDAKSMALEAKKRGFRMMLPDLKVGRSMQDVVQQLKQMNANGEDCSSKVFIFDTLKKMTDVINKRQAKELFTILRGLTGKGMTIVLLAHTNKHKDDEGKPIFEGTGDIRSDADEMIYLESQKHSDNSMTVSTIPDKVRGDFKPLTFEITSDRRVIPSREYIDVKKERKDREQRNRDQEVIEMIQEALGDSSMNQTEVVEYCKPAGFGPKRVREILKRYDKKDWYTRRGQKNSLLYSKEYSG